MGEAVPAALEKSPVDAAYLEENLCLEAPDRPEVPFPERSERRVERIACEHAEREEVDHMGARGGAPAADRGLPQRDPRGDREHRERCGRHEGRRPSNVRGRKREEHEEDRAAAIEERQPRQERPTGAAIDGERDGDAEERQAEDRNEGRCHRLYSVPPSPCQTTSAGACSVTP